jgi:Pyruvate/2-oxoacid:ferredoxin oxidoreductase delta subunit
VKNAGKPKIIVAGGGIGGNCYGVCPDNAVIKLGPGMGFEFNLDYCKGCGICAQECPCGAIQMTPEAI